MSKLTFILGIISMIFVTFMFIRWLLHLRIRRYPTGPFGLPIVGHLFFFGNNQRKTFMNWWKSYGDVFSIRLGSWNAIVVNGYSAVKAAAEHPDDAFSGRPNFVSVNVFKERVSEVTFALKTFSPLYLKQRKLASKALRLVTFKQPEVLEELVTNETEAFIDKLVKQNQKDSSFIKGDIETLAVRIVYQFLYGRNETIAAQKHMNTLISTLESFNELPPLGSVIDVIPWLRYIMPGQVDKLGNNLVRSYDVMKETVNNHYETFTPGDIRDLADAVIAHDVDDEESEDRYVLTRERLNFTLGDLQGAGVDTTNKTLSWLFLYMTKYPEIQERVFAEIQDKVGTERKVMLSDKPDLVYTNAVILEVMRVVTQLPFSVPHCAIKNAKLQDFDIEKDTVVIFNLYSVHHEKAFWGDPENFRPERFLSDENNLDKEKCNHIFAFSHGRRRCIGEFFAKMTLFLVFSTVIQKCKFCKPDGEELDITPIPGLVYSPNPYKVLVLERN